MPESFMHLGVKDQTDILRYYASIQAERDLEISEKDLWVCWVLKQLFEMPQRLKMAFKGGTSLSKVYNVIDRFSEDIDVTLDYRQFEAVRSLGLLEGQTAPDDIGSGTLRRINKALKREVQAYAEDVVAPYLQAQVASLPRSELFEIKVMQGGEAIQFRYPSVLKERNQYILGYILIELGGRNIIDPNEIWTVQPYMADQIEEIAFPSSQVTVLSPERTFWEKATLIHVECHRGVRETAERLSRHWFDLMALGNHQIGQQAMQNIPLLHDVVQLKNIFFNASYAHYDKCLQGEFLLLPNQDGLRLLTDDFNKMRQANMLYNSQVDFERIVASARQLQDLINASVQGYGR